MDNRKPNTLAPLMKDISQALQFDRAERNEEAYRKYLECTLRITTKLLKDLHTNGGHVQTTPDLVKTVKLGQQCMDRVAIIVNERLDKVAPQKPVARSALPIGAKSATITPPTTPHSRDTTPSSYGPVVVSPATPGSRSSGVTDTDRGQRSLKGSSMVDTTNLYGQKKLSPMENAARMNQQLLTVFQARQAQARRGGNRSVAANLSLTLQRKMAENLAIAKAQEEILAKKMKERQQRLEEQATRRFHTPVGLSEEEQQQRQIYRRVLEFEQEELWMIDLRKGLETDPTNTNAISKLITSVLGCDSHPLTELLKSYQAKLIKTLYPLVERKVEQVDRIKVPLPEILLASLKTFRKVETDSGHKSSQERDSKNTTDIAENTGAIDIQQVVDAKEEDKADIGEHDDDAVISSAIVSDTVTPDSSKESERDTDEDTDEDVIGKTTGDKKEDRKKSEGDQDNEANNDNSLKDKPEKDAQSKEFKDGEMEEDNRENETTVTVPDCECGKGEMKDDDTVEDTPSAEEQIAAVADDDNDDMAVICSDIKTDLKAAIIKGEKLKAKLDIENQRVTIMSKRVPSDYEKYNQENMDDLFDDSDSDDAFEDELATSEDPTSDSKQPISAELGATVDISEKSAFQTNETSDKNKKSDSKTTSESSMEYTTDKSKSESADFDSQNLKPSMQKNASFDNLENQINDLKNEAYHRYLAGITEDILTSIEKVQVLFVIAFEELGSPEGRDQCNVLLEGFFFRPLWKYLLVLFRLANEPKELAIAHHMTCQQACSPRDFSVRERLCLFTSTDTVSSSSDEQRFPYEAAVKELVSMEQYSSMLEKLECLVRTSRVVMQCVETHYKLKEEQVPDIGADDLLPILCYVVTRSCFPQIVSECHAMDRFIHEGYMFGEEGYCLTSFQTAINYLISQGLKGCPQAQT